MTTLIPQIALVDDTHNMDRDELAHVAAALTSQVQNDFAPTWHKTGAVTTAKPGPATWQVHITNKMDEPGALGYHTNDSHNQPVAYVLHDDGWTVTASHEVLEMLLDPFGSYMHSARLPFNIEDRWRDFDLPTHRHHVHYLVEACDPCEATTYEIGSIVVSDFLTGHYYRTNPKAGAHYSYQDGVLRPREVAEDGYVSFATDEGEWYQVFVRNGRAEVNGLGKFDATNHRTVREFTDAAAREWRVARSL